MKKNSSIRTEESTWEGLKVLSGIYEICVGDTLTRLVEAELCRIDRGRGRRIALAPDSKPVADSRVAGDGKKAGKRHNRKKRGF